jgi:hypothetical protein
MRASDHTVHLKFTLPILILLIVSGGVWLSIHTDEPHWLNRAGAVVAAIAAGSILGQIKAEMRVEEERARVESQKNAVSQKTPPTTPLDELANSLAVKRLELQKARLSHQRLVVAAFVVCSAMLGEFLHGFGDLFMCFVFAVCASH